MTRTSRRTALLCLLLLATAGTAAAQVDTGSANFSRYVAVGDSLTAGFYAGGLVRDVTLNSYPALIWRQASGAASGFEQPLVSQPGAPPILALTSLSPLVLAPKGSQAGSLTNPLITRPYNNLGVPGARIRDFLTNVTSGLHPLVLQQFSPALQGKTAQQQALMLQPTFVSLWLGNNDVLNAAVSGLVIDGVTLTTTAQFDMDYRAAVTSIAASGAKLVIANLPDVTAIPFVTTIPRVLVNPATQQPVLIGGQPVPLLGPNGPLAAGDFVLLPASAALAQGIGIPAQAGGTGQPLPDNLVLSAAEVATIRARTDAFNTIIRSVANQVGAAFVDIHEEFNQIAAHGITVGGVSYTTAFLTGGFFSFDGVHPTPFGYAFLANEFIAAINDTFGGDIPPANLFPFMFGPQASAGIIPLPSTAPATAELSAEAVSSLFWALDVRTSAPQPAKPAKKPRGKRGGRR